MERTYYPVLLELTGQPCVVVGGGLVAERKVEGLCAAGAAVTVISPALTPLLQQQVEEKLVRHTERNYRSGDLLGYRLAFAATSNREVNAAVHQEGRERGVWVNTADDPTYCDFILPAVVRRGHLTVAVATGGTSPAFARAIREELEAYFSADYGLLSEVAAEVRQRLRVLRSSSSGERWSNALKNEGFRRLIRGGCREKATVWLLEQLGGEQ